MRLIAILTGICVLAAVLPSAQAQVAGGWADASIKDQGVIQAAQFAVDAQQQAMKAAGKDDKITLVKVLGARHQVVAGMNYNLTLQVKVGEAVKSAEATVWARPWLKGEEQYKLTSWKFVDEKEEKHASGNVADAPKAGPVPSPIKVTMQGPLGNPKLAGLKRFASQEELDKALGAGEVTLQSEVDFAKEDVLCVGWVGGGSPRQLKWTSTETDGITFYVEERPTKIHNNVRWVQADWFTVPKGTKATMGGPKIAQEVKTEEK